MNMINTIIVDDEPLAIEILETYLKDYEDFELIGSCKNALEANKLLKENKVDVMFLDIQMPQLNGIEFLKILDNPPDRKSTRLNSSHVKISYAVFCLK